MLGVGVLCCLAAGCTRVERGFDDGFVGVGVGLAAGLSQAFGQIAMELRAHPGSLRAGLGMTCGSQAICKNGIPEEGDRCQVERDTFSPDFSATFDACLATGEERNACFASALAAHEPFPQQAQDANTCREALEGCPELETDACDALEVLDDPKLIESLLECTLGVCDEMASCFLQALLAGTPELPDECGWSPITGVPGKE